MLTILISRKRSDLGILDTCLSNNCGCLNIDASRVGTKITLRTMGAKCVNRAVYGNYASDDHVSGIVIGSSIPGRFPSNVILGNSELLSHLTSGNSYRPIKLTNSYPSHPMFTHMDKGSVGYGDSGSVSRFFKVIG